MSVPEGLVEKMVAASECGFCSIHKATHVAHDHYKAEIAELISALKEIAGSRYTSYENTQHGIYQGPYGIGVTDGHRVCATIARTALAKHQPALEKKDSI